MKIAIEPSNVVGSPYRYMFIYLTPELENGKYILISNAEEFGEKGILVGMYDHYEDSKHEPSRFDDFETAMSYLEGLLSAA